VTRTYYTTIVKKINIHLIEDDEDDIHWLNRIMKKHTDSVNLKIHNNGREALAFLMKELENNAQIDLILLDINMPIMNGYEFLKKIRKIEKLKLIPIVVITSATDQDSFQEAYLCGANSVICKDKIFDSSADLIQLMMDYWLHLSERPRIGWESQSAC